MNNERRVEAVQASREKVIATKASAPARLLRFLIAIVVSAVVPSPVVAEDPSSTPNQLTDQELAAGWILLFDGHSAFGWTATSEADWTIRDGAIHVSEGQPGLWRTTNQFADFELKVDFRAGADTNSGIFLRTSPQPKNPASDCYELNIAEPQVSPFPTGSLVGRKKGESTVYKDDWRSYHIRADGGNFKVWLDGKKVLDYTDPNPRGRGYIGLQLNHGAVAFRNVKLRPLRLQPLTKGDDLSGWQEFPGKPAEFGVNEAGEITIQNGPGQLESEAQFADFVLQLEAYVDGDGLNSGIFFRSIPGEFWQGYECQIENNYHDGDRTKPVDCGTGGFYRRQDARRVMGDDRRWFHITLLACDNRMSTWVDGYPVADWVDRRGRDENPRRGLRLDAGTIILQAHDPTTNLRFRGLRAVEMTPR